MRAEVVAVGTELLLGQITDTNSTYIGTELARSGIDCHYQTRVGDNLDRIVAVLRSALGRAEAVIVTGGLGPTQDDITREAIAAVMGVELRRDPEALTLLEAIFAARSRPMPTSNLQQADVPVGATIIPQVVGTAPGLICPVGESVIYAVPGVPHEMEEMLARAVLPDLRRRAGEPAVIVSRTLRTAGISEAALSELVAPRLEALDRTGAATIAFLASGIEGVKVRVTVKAPDDASAVAVLDAEEAALRAILGDAVFGVDDETIEVSVGRELVEAGFHLAVAESFTGGLIASRIVAVAGASTFFSGGVVAYDPEVKFSLLGVARGPVVTAETAIAMAEGVRRLFGADVGVATTGVAGPDPLEGHPPGTAFVGLSIATDDPEAAALSLVGSRTRVREAGSLSALDLLRRRLATRSLGSR